MERKDSGIGVGEDVRREVREAFNAEMKAAGVANSPALGLGPNAVRCTDEARDSVPPSPLGLSNYDALDDEDDWYGSYDEDDGESSVLDFA